MSDEPNSKRRKMSKNKNYYHNQKKNYMEPGIRGFLATCNYREKDCVRECYNLLNEYVDQVPSQHENEVAIESEKTQPKATFNDSGTAAEEEEEEEDISTLLEKEIKTITTGKKTDERRFQQVDTKVNNCIFIKTTIPNPKELGVYLMRDIAETKCRKTRFLQRLWPVDAICKAKIEDISNTAGLLFDKVFLNVEPTTYSIIVNKRLNASIDRMAVIKNLAELIDFKNSAHKVNLKNPKHTIVVEVIKGLCCLSILPDYFKLKKFNVSELTQPKEEEKSTEKENSSKNEKSAEEEIDSKEEKPAEEGNASKDEQSVVETKPIESDDSADNPTDEKPKIDAPEDVKPNE